MNILLKQYDQKTISENNGTTPSYVDTYFANFKDSTEGEGAEQKTNAVCPLGDSLFGLDDVVQRGAFPVTYRVFYQHTTGNVWTELFPVDGAGDKEFLSVDEATDGIYVVQGSIEVNESVIGLAPIESFGASEAGLHGVTNFELTLSLNDCKNIWNEYSGRPISEVKGGVHKGPAGVSAHGLTATNHPIRKESQLRMTQLTVQDSSFGKFEALSKLAIIQYEAQVSPIQYIAATTYNTDLTVKKQAADTKIVMSQQLNLGIIPDKVFIQVRVPYGDLHSGMSNSSGYSVKQLKIRFNNKAGILTEQDAHELYLTSKKNGSTQSWAEFSGNMTTSKSNSVRSIGSIMVIDPTMDLDIEDTLSSGSSGTFQFQVTVEFNNQPFYDTYGVEQDSPYELVVMYSYHNVLTTQEGKSAVELAYLTMENVLDTKEKESAMNYTELTEQMSGGKKKPIELSGVGDFLKRSGKVIDAAKDVSSAVKGAGYSQTGGGYGLVGAAVVGGMAANALDAHL
jgi:hypothetical protein